ncbi:alkaline phosphatase PhoX [Pseudonocardia acidicola]|uniref:alkaline phosphatase PhoX n=1 Tax=Pseudonocardia acidicola TaxID=2724939 RepID=UPI003083F05E
MWFYDPARATLTLTLLFGAVDDDPFDGPDNIRVSPHGGVIVAEDGQGAQYLLGATADGVTFPVARNDEGAEFTGPVYSADGAVLFADIQQPGVTFAIAGPWRRA